tara:strand:- start:8 stop:679 length:672 start_codon:yes stop_codon:yes gene_type:complete
MNNPSEVDYGSFTLKYNWLESHATHAPTKMTSKGKIWEKKLFDLYSTLLTKDDEVIDCGTYIGTHTLPFSHFAKTVYAFEPNSEIYSVLKSNIELNNATNIFSYCVGVSNKEGQLSFDNRNDGTSRIVKHTVKGKVTTIETVRLDNLLSHLKTLKLIKIDCENHEFQTLDGASDLIKQHKPYILIECYKYKRDRLRAWCVDNNYNLEWLRGDDFFLVHKSNID